MKGEEKSDIKKPTQVNLGSMKWMEAPGVAFGKLRKSPPEVKDETIKGERKSVMNDPTKETDETVVDSSAHGLVPLYCGVQIFLPSLTPVNQELHSMPQILPPSLPPIFKGNLPLDNGYVTSVMLNRQLTKQGVVHANPGEEVRGVH
jgi:hypothetical protein